MNALLLFFALPIATIILSIVLEKILNCPILVAATFFAIFLVVTFAAFDSCFLVFAIAYTILAFITAALVKTICNFIRKCCNNNNSNDNNCPENDNSIDNGSDSGCICSRGDMYPMPNYARRYRR